VELQRWSFSGSGAAGTQSTPYLSGEKVIDQVVVVTVKSG
jgi:hypothetical protein